MGARMRTATISRRTSETSIDVTVNLDGTGVYRVSTGIGFFDHMLEQLSRHSLIDLDVKTVGDLHIDQHHTGALFTKALHNRRANAMCATGDNGDFPRQPARAGIAWLPLGLRLKLGLVARHLRLFAGFLDMGLVDCAKLIDHGEILQRVSPPMSGLAGTFPG